MAQQDQTNNPTTGGVDTDTTKNPTGTVPPQPRQPQGDAPSTEKNEAPASGKTDTDMPDRRGDGATEEQDNDLARTKAGQPNAEPSQEGGNARPK